MKRLYWMSSMLAVLAGVAAAADFLPLAQGNTWVYRNRETNQSITIAVGSPVAMQSGRVYHYLTGYTPQRLLVRMDDQQRLVYLDEEHGRETLLGSFDTADQTWWEAGQRECIQQAQTQARRETYSGPSGSWSGTVNIAYRTLSCHDVGVVSEKFVENIGMVQREITTFAGPRTFDLVHARIGTHVIEEGERGRFSVSAVPVIQAQAWRVTLRTDFGRNSGLRLQFPSGQVFDARLRDGQSNILWAWSADKFFTQAVQDRFFSSSWSETFEVPYPKAGIQQSPFSIEAWLTTAEGSPKFAAAAVVATPVALD